MSRGIPHNDEVAYTSNPSGNAYVSARLRGDGRDRIKLRIRAERTCDHLHTICVKCAASWSWDWELEWARTGGGRSLKELLDKREVKV